MRDVLIDLVAFFLTGAFLSIAALIVRDWRWQRQRDQEARAWRRQWYDDYRKQQERHR